MGMRGLVAFDVVVRSGTIDLHSGTFGGSVPNSAHVIGRLVAALHDAGGRVAVPALYDDVGVLTQAEERSLLRLTFAAGERRHMARVEHGDDERGLRTRDRVWPRPIRSVLGIHAACG